MRPEAPAIALAFFAACRPAGADFVVELRNSRFDNGLMTQIGYAAGGSTHALRGTLTAVGIDVTLVDGSPNTLASDLGIVLYGSNRLAQAGGGFNFYAEWHYPWSNGHDDAPGTRCVDTVFLDPQFYLSGLPTEPDPIIAIGVLSANWPNGAWATWTGTVTLIGLDWQEVPGPAAWVALIAASMLPRGGRVRRRP